MASSRCVLFILNLSCALSSAEGNTPTPSPETSRLRPRTDGAHFGIKTKHFCCGSAFLLHDNGVLVPLKLQTFETGFQSGIFWNHKLLPNCVNWQTAKPAKAVTTLMLMLTLQCFPQYTKLWLNSPQCTQSRLNMTTVCWGEFKRS